MKPFLPLFFLLAASQLNAQGFTISPYQDYSLSSPIAADFTGDSLPDVLGLQFTSPPKVVLQVNKGTQPISFAEKNLGLSFETTGRPAAADLDGDTDLDVVIAKGSNLDLFLLRNDNSGNFTMDSLGVSGTSSFLIADVDHDDDLDIVGFNGANGAIKVYFNDGALHFTTVTVLASSSNLEVFDIGDLDGDKDVDIAVGFYQFSGKQIVLYTNKDNNTFEEKVLVNNNFSSISGLRIGDLNNDGKNDIIAVKFFTCDAFINNGNLSFTQKNLFSPSGIIRSLLLGDYNGDGKKDIVLGFNSSNITWYKNLSNSTLEFSAQNVGSVQPAFSMVNADLDRDGDTDLVVSNGEFWWYENIISQEVSTVTFPDAAINIYPNPFRNRIYLNNIENGSYYLTLTDAMGRQVYATAVTTKEIELPTIPTGLYFLQLSEARSGLSRSVVMVKSE